VIPLLFMIIATLYFILVEMKRVNFLHPPVQSSVNMVYYRKITEEDVL